MHFTVREIKPSEYALLNEFLYQAIFVPEGLAAPDRSILLDPALRIYTEAFGHSKHDKALVAYNDGKVIGACWVRIMRDYGHIDDRTPSLAISLLPDYRSQGVGAILLDAMLTLLKTCGYRRVSLSVQKANQAVRLYQKAGFVIFRDQDGEYIMVKEL